jgi:hypothetical protein
MLGDLIEDLKHYRRKGQFTYFGYACRRFQSLPDSLIETHGVRHQ